MLLEKQRLLENIFCLMLYPTPTALGGACVIT